MMMNVALVTGSLGLLWICTGASLAAEKGSGGEKVSLVKDGAIVLKNNEYMLMPSDFGKLEQGGGLLVQYPPGKEGRWVSVSAFYFENVRGRVVNAAAKPVSGNSVGMKQGYLVEVSPVFPLDPQEAWYLKRKSKPAELFKKKIAVSHIEEEYTFLNQEDAEQKLAHGVLANALVTGSSRPMLASSAIAHGRGDDADRGNEDATDDKKDEDDHDKPGQGETGNGAPESSGPPSGADPLEGSSSGSAGGSTINSAPAPEDQGQANGGNSARPEKTVSHQEFSGSTLDVAGGEQVRLVDVLIHAANSGITLGGDSTLILDTVPSTDFTVALNVSYGDGNFSLTSPDTWTTNALISGVGQASMDFSGGVNLVLTDCSRGLIEQLVASHVTTISFVLFDKETLLNTFKGDPSKALLLYDEALRNAGFVLKNGDSWMQDGVVTLVRDGTEILTLAVPEPGTAALGLLGVGALLLRRRRK